MLMSSQRKCLAWLSSRISFNGATSCWRYVEKRKEVRSPNGSTNEKRPSGTSHCPQALQHFKSSIMINSYQKRRLLQGWLNQSGQHSPTEILQSSIILRLRSCFFELTLTRVLFQKFIKIKQTTKLSGMKYE